MFLTRSEYDRGVNTFSPEGRLFQVEYAIEAMKLGSTSIGICTSQGIVLGGEKRITSSLMEPSAIEKIVEIDAHIGCAASGLMADTRMLVERARLECAHHKFSFDEPMSVESVAQAVSNRAIKFGDSDDEHAMSRPFGMAMLFGGIDHKGVQLYYLDPSGTFIEFEAKAIGSGSEGAQQTLQEMYHKSLTLDEGVQIVLSILKQVMEEKLSSENVEIATVTPEKLYHMLSKDEVMQALNAVKE